MTIVVIGKTSFLAQEFCKIAPEYLYLSYQEAITNNAWIDQAECVINFAFAPSLRISEYNEADDVDSKIARLIEPKNAHYIMLSSRMVYGQSNELKQINESQTPEPTNFYGRSKLLVEKSLASVLPQERLTFLRIANVFGFEWQRNSFFGQSLSRLSKEDKIVFDMSGDSVRDFISVNQFTNYLKRIANNPQDGIYNLGSGLETACGEIAHWIIEGYGSGYLEVTSQEARDQFVLDMHKTRDTFKLPEILKEDIRSDCLQCGITLRKMIKDFHL